jgi:hypothetical protein
MSETISGAEIRERMLTAMRETEEALAAIARGERIPVEAMRGSLRFDGDIIEPLEEWDCEK